ncbi:hypothetical protein HZH68_008971 [Vespula germanica]|uniref:Uncharacterized protein n=1 Tax=Vespula germanica TaxID=30212 RepID=A0A834JZT3_VESGE|nr:hypothetical protein HZH68_008971 [Vespula germanica]
MRNWESVNDQIREGSPNFTWTGTECIKSCNFVCIMKTNETYYYNDVLNVIALHFLREEMKTKLDRGELNSSSDNFRDLLLYIKLRRGQFFSAIPKVSCIMSKIKGKRFDKEKIILQRKALVRRQKLCRKSWRKFYQVSGMRRRGEIRDGEERMRTVEKEKEEKK